MFFDTFKPHPELEPLIRYYWILNFEQISIPDMAQQALAEGVELMFNLGDPIEMKTNTSSTKTVKHVSISGPLTKPMRLKANGRVDIFGVCFRAGGAYSFFSYPAYELTNGLSDAQELWGNKGRGLVEQFFNSCLTPKDRVDYLDRYFLKQLEQNNLQDDRVAEAIHTIESQNGLVSVDEVAKNTGISNRHLERKFKERVGLSPKQLSRSLRFKHFVSCKLKNPEVSWLDTALDCGYYDQAHMINDFKHYTGLSPSAYFADPAAIDHFFTANF
jgi:AraC-like DNA-binding protein